MIRPIILLFLAILFNTSTSQESRVMSHQRCTYDVDCKPNSFCFNNDAGLRGNCKCKDGYILFGNLSFYECLEAVVSIGSPCLLDEQCELTLGKSSECYITNTCRCLPSAHFIREKNSCYATSRYNETCVSSENCLSQQGEPLECSYGRCTCGLNEHVAKDGRCVKTVHIGGPCASDDQCLHLEAVCRVVCDCRVGYVVADNQHNCLKAAVLLGDACIQLSQCNSHLQNTVCASGSCECEGGHHRHGNVCYRNKFVGEPCSDRKECIRGPRLEGLVDCVTGVCACTGDGDPDRDCEPNKGAVPASGCLLGALMAGIAFLLM